MDRLIGPTHFLGCWLSMEKLPSLPHPSNVDCSRVEQELTQIFAVTPSMLCIAGLDGYFKRINLTFGVTLGYSDETLLAQPFISFVHPNDRAATLAELQRLSNGEAIGNFENRYRCQDGTYRWLLWSAISNLEKGLVYAAARDITERKQAEQALQQDRDFTQAILNTVGALVVVLDPQGKIVSFNHACETVTGYSREIVRGRCVWDFLLIPEEAVAMQAIFEPLAQGQPSLARYESHWVSKDGSQRLIDWSNTVLTDADGAVEYVIATGIDITERRADQQRLEQQNRQGQLLTDLSRKIRQSLDLNEILQTTVTEVQGLLACDRVFILQGQPDGTGQTVAEAFTQADFSLIQPGIQPTRFPPSYLDYHRLQSVSATPTRAKLPTQLIALLSEISVQSELVVSIITHGRFWGLLVAHHCTQPRDWHSIEVNLMQQLADQIGVTIDQAELLNNLESLVTERTLKLTQINTLLQQEIGERHQTELALRESEQKFAGILDIAEEAIISVDQDQQIQLFNQGAERIFGYRAAEVIGQSLDILLPSSSRQAHRQHVHQFAASGAVSQHMAERSSQVSGLRKNGEEFPAKASISRLQTKAGNLFTVIIEDITVRQQAEAALRRSEEQLRLTTNALPVLISYVDLRHRYQFNNRAYETWFGRPYAQMQGLHLSSVLGAATYRSVLPYLEQALAGQMVTFETAFPHQDGDSHWVSISYIPDIQAGRVKGCFGLTSDISDRKATERLKDEFVSVVSHELRTPLTSVHGSLKLLATGQLGTLADEGKALLEIALKNTERLTRLINDVLDLERIESGQVTMAQEYCLASDLIDAAMQAIQAMAQAHDITFQVQAEPITLWADPDHIVQTLINLFSNAVKFSPPGETVRVQATTQGQQVRFQIKDRGRGIPSDKLETIFERFQQVDASDSRERGGTGLGLAICREIVQRHGGRIWVMSHHGEGSQFCFTLPKDPEPNPHSGVSGGK